MEQQEHVSEPARGHFYVCFMTCTYGQDPFQRTWIHGEQALGVLDRSVLLERTKNRLISTR